MSKKHKKLTKADKVRLGAEQAALDRAAAHRAEQRAIWLKDQPWFPVDADSEVEAVRVTSRLMVEIEDKDSDKNLKNEVALLRVKLSQTPQHIRDMAVRSLEKAHFVAEIFEDAMT